MKNKTIEAILAPPDPHMVGDGFRVHNFFPGGYAMSQHRLSPFFLLDYNSLVEFSPRENPRGVGVHPHRGFETVTIAFKGAIAHHDSSGNSGIITEGGVQWMTAGKGVLHKEYHEKEFSKKGGAFQMVQLWVNLPAKYKMTEPRYQGFNKEDFNVFELPNNEGQVRVVAGEYKGSKGAAQTFSPMHMYVLDLAPNAKEEFELPEHFNTLILQIEGESTVNESVLKLNHMAIFHNNGTSISIVNSNSKSVLLLLSGEPIQEPIFAYGPFLMNTREEVVQAYDDLAKGLFGTLEE
jgi:redox-sensitive bicupin YhaK (pirin superfamily)